MTKKKKDELLDSNYDGIEEYDNDLPRWWLWLFFTTVVFSIIYSIHHLVGYRISGEDRVLADLKVLQANQPAGTETVLTEEILLAKVGDADAIGRGKGIYTAKCQACHADQGQGLVGPNLTDEFWIHGGKLTEIRNVIVNGVPAKGMLSWKGLLSDNDITDVTLFINSLRGTNPPGAKAPEGQKYVDQK